MALLVSARDDAERGCGISVVDPGAEPGGSTTSGSNVAVFVGPI